MKYFIGLIKYIVKGVFLNTRAFLIFGGIVFSWITLYHHTSQGEPMVGVLSFLSARYLPPPTPEAFAGLVLLGASVAGFRWYFRTPRN